MTDTMEDFKYVKNLGVIMAQQDNLSTQYPIYVVQAEQRRYSSESDYDERERVEDTDEADLCTICLELYNNGQELPADCHSCDDEAFDHYIIDTYYAVDKAGVFFTSQGCQTHIDTNKHHYRNPVVYCLSAWRNYEMQAVMRQVITAGDQKVPNHYA